ncbi:high affinity immunoglobulin epsilon receptor subunit beta [Physeter macrocephalus]|uniref:high affinity immunoglobulin epsilon receptor subunit beta n=1 Tax=Physeter macrocephalus TaxID=9755 RepID=UPI000CEABE2F|nr:high affinity immunoglobulin epsilon receptor subunit beta [Physeter catodon]|eukprot:XP_007123848.2 high affinity immunoglobulin epsilon receptor subunit beta-like [Physeter catodon]
MDTEIGSRTDLALPNPQEPTSVPEIELSILSLHDNDLLENAAPSPPRQTWLTFLKKELEFLGVTQILISLICLYFGIFVCSVFNSSEFKDFFSSFKAGYPFWGAVFFAISGFLSVMSEKKQATYLIQGSLGANTVSSIAGGLGIIILIINLKKSSAYIYHCRDIYENDFCFVASISTKIVAMILFLTILGFCSAVSLTVHGIGEVIERNKIPEDRLYEEVNTYAPIYSELEDGGEATSPTDS